MPYLVEQHSQQHHQHNSSISELVLDVPIQKQYYGRSVDVRLVSINYQNTQNTRSDTQQGKTSLIFKIDKNTKTRCSWTCENRRTNIRFAGSGLSSTLCDMVIIALEFAAMFGQHEKADCSVW